MSARNRVWRIAARADASVQNSRLLLVVKECRAAGEFAGFGGDLRTGGRTRVLGGGRQCLESYGHGTRRGVLPQMVMRPMTQRRSSLCYVQGKHVREVAEFDLSADPGVAAMEEYFARQIELAGRHGLEKIFLDPGLGFYYRNLQDSKVRVRHQMTTFLNTFRLRRLGFPICHALPHAFEYFGEEVRCAEPFFAVLAALGKTDLFRTHEVPRIKAVLDTLRVY